MEEEKSASSLKDAAAVESKAEAESAARLTQEEKRERAKAERKAQKLADELADSRNHVAQQVCFGGREKRDMTYR